MKRNRRTLERALLAFVTLILACGLALVHEAKALPSITPPVTSATLDLNTATSKQIAEALSISRADADRFAAYRSRLPFGEFQSVYSVRNCPPLRSLAIDWTGKSFCVRSPQEADRSFLIESVLLLGVFWLGHLALMKWKKDADPFIVPLMMFLTGLGLIMVYSVKDPYRDALSSLAMARAVIIVGPIACAIPLLKWFERLPLHRYVYAYALASIALMAVLISPFGYGPGGAKVMAFGCEPVEFIKILLVFFAASYLAERRLSIQTPWKSSKHLPELRDLIPLAAVYLFLLVLFALVKDMGPALLLYAVFVTLTYLVTGRKVYPIIAGILVVIAGLVCYKAQLGFLATRVDMWLHPWNNPDRLGGQLAMGEWGMATGGVFGSGLGLGNPAFVPRAGSDMIFTSICEELGIFGGLLALLAYSVLVWRGFAIARDAADDFHRLLAAGLTSLIGLQAFVITAGATGLLPLTGVTLPFVSYGGSSITADFFSAGVLLWLSSKRLPEGLSPAPPHAYPAASKLVMTLIVSFLLIGVGIGRLVYIQAIRDDQIAVHPLRIPDLDGVTRTHYNPRLALVAKSIPRGRILDRNGKVLARNPASGETGVSYLCGRPRIYPYGEIGANLVYAAEQPASSQNVLGADAKLSGLESGKALLAMYRAKDLPFAPRVKGEDAHLTIDIDLQKATQDALEREALRKGNGCGAAIAIDVKTGETLAAATCPTFDPSALGANQWDNLHSSRAPDNPLLNRPFAGLYPPGSSFKLVTASAALENGDAGFHAVCNHLLPAISWTFNGRRYTRRRITDEAGMPPHGYEGMDNALRVSCNVYFSQLAVDIGAVDFNRQIRKYGFSHCPTLADLGADLPDCGYGQGKILVTPFEMARVCQTIAGRGEMMPERDFFSDASPAPEQVIAAPNAQSLGKMMLEVCQRGTAAGVFDDLGYDVAGKTGSAQLSRGKTHSWFVGFAPYANPKIAVACIIERGGQGRAAAALTVRDMLKASVKRP